MFWLFGMARTIFLFSPLFYLFFGLKIYMASVPQVMAYVMPYLVSSFFISNFLFGKYRWPLFSELYETAQSIFLLPAIVSVFLNPAKPSFKVTPKGQNLMQDFLSPLIWPFLFFFIACLLSFPMAYFRWQAFPLERDVVLICTSWAGFHIFILLLCIGSVLERHQHRRHPRSWAEGSVIITDSSSERSIKADMQDLSLGGMGIIIPKVDWITPGDTVMLTVEDSYKNCYSFNAEILRARLIDDHRLRVALRFLIADQQEYEQLIGFVYGDSLRWKRYQERKRKAVPVIKGVLYLMSHGLRGAGTAFNELVNIGLGYLKPTNRTTG
jgi:cellulose synthase (UDP-forming)